MKCIVACVLFTLILTTAVVAFACSPGPACSIDSLEGEIPCVQVNQGYECGLTLEWSCADSGAETIITLDDGTRAAMSAAAPTLDVRVGSNRRPEETMTSQRRINWLSGAQSGGLVVEYTERAFSGCGDQEDPIFGDSSCAATPPQRPAAPLTALLPMILGALLWRRHSRP